MSIGAKITKQVGEDKYEIEVDPVNWKKDPIIAGVCHDYALFSTYTSLFTETGVSIKGGVCSNMINIKASVQIPIRAMGEIILPMLNDSEHLKEDVFKTKGVWSEAPVRIWADSKAVNVFDKGKNKYVEISLELYEQLTGEKA